MTFNYLISLCNPETLEGPEPSRIGGIVQDSRQVEHDDVFVAVRGYESDGHDYIGQSIENGASTIIHDRPLSEYKPNVCYVKVQNTRKVLGPLAQAYYDHPSHQMHVIGITGTNGKTTVATLVYQVLKKMGARPSLMGTNANIIENRKSNTQLTTPGPVELAEQMHNMVQSGSTHLVMEVSSHALDQRRTDGIHFSLAAFTNISHDHLDYHGSMDEYVVAKKRLFDQLDEYGVAVLNADDSHCSIMIKDCVGQVQTFGFESNADVNCQVISHSLSGLTLRVGGEEFSSPLCGRFNAYNLSLAYLIGTELGYDKKKVSNALSESPGAEGRLQKVSSDNGQQPTVYVDYAHTPQALQNVLETLKELKEEQQTLAVVFGCGGERDKEKRPMMAQVAEKYADYIKVTSDNPRSESPESILNDIREGFSSTLPVKFEVDRKEAIQQTIQDANKNTVVLIAGKGHETYQILKDKRIDFDDREVARHALELKSNARDGEVA